MYWFLFELLTVVGVSGASDTLCFNILVYYFSTKVYIRNITSSILVRIPFVIEVSKYLGRHLELVYYIIRPLIHPWMSDAYSHNFHPVSKGLVR